MSIFAGCDGVMVARGILNNPALFKGYDKTPIACINDWLKICSLLDTHFTCFHNHLIYMLSAIHSKAEKRVFNCLKTKSSVLDYLKKRFGDDIVLRI